MLSGERRRGGAAARFCIALLAGLLATRGGSALRAEETAPPRAPAAAAIERLLADDAGEPPAEVVDQRDALSRLYAGAEFAPLWSDDDGPTDAAMQTMASLVAAERNGLHAADYDVAALRERASALKESGSDPDRARFDVALSGALLRFIAALHGGRVDPALLRFDIAPHSRHTLDGPEMARRIAAGADVEAEIAALEPRLLVYAHLKDALLRYRRLAREAAALPPMGELGNKLSPGDAGAGVAGLRALLVLLGDLAPQGTDAPAPDVYEPALVEAVQRFQLRHGLDPDGVIGGQTRRVLAVPLERRVAQIELNLERLRWLPDAAGPVVLVNIPEFRLRAFADAAGEPALDMKVIVGSAARKRDTAVFAAEIRGVSFRPYWNVPRSITSRELEPQIANDPSYLERHDMEIVAPSATGAAEAQPASPEALAALRSGRYRLRQRPGARNALGFIKFLMPNRYDIYLHDTPSVALFARSRRDFSHGCVRVEMPVDLALFVLAGVADWDRERIEDAMRAPHSRQVTLPTAIPVWLYYLTAVAGPGGDVSFLEDIYDLDAALARRLAPRTGGPGRSSAGDG